EQPLTSAEHGLTIAARCAGCTRGKRGWTAFPWDRRRQAWTRRGDAMAVQPEDVTGGESGFRHHMIREIHEQAEVIGAAIRHRLQGGRVVERVFGSDAPGILDRVRAV